MVGTCLPLHWLPNRGARVDVVEGPLQKYPRQIVSQVLAAIDIVDLIGGSLELKRAGSGRFVGLCPFHTEKTPSFTVNHDRQIYYCFGCEKHGDAISFLCEHDGLTFTEALQKLADKAGIRLPAPSERDSREDVERKTLVEIGRFAARHFRETLMDPMKGGKARQYLKSRALRPETENKFGLGYAPDSYNSLLDTARAAGFREDMLVGSGLVKKSERGTVYDFFRDRLMIPIHDVSGNVVAFGGRDLSGGQATAKYINTHENLLYKKSRILFGLYENRDAIRRSKQAILVEGYFDLMRCSDAGIDNVVAPCGTALTQEQAHLIRRYATEVVVVFDGDAAGVRAAVRGVAILVQAGLTVRALVIPDGKDPDEYIRDAGAEAFAAAVNGADDFVAFYIRMSESRISTIEGRTQIADELFSMVQAIEEDLRRDEYLKQIARGLQLDEWTVRRAFVDALREKGARRSEPSSEPSGYKPVKDDCDFLAILLSDESAREQTRAELSGMELPPDPLVETLKALFNSGGTEPSPALETEAARKLYAAASAQPAPEGETANAVFKRRIARLKRQGLERRRKRVAEDLRAAERAKDSGRVVELLAQQGDISKKIEALGAT